MPHSVVSPSPPPEVCHLGVRRHDTPKERRLRSCCHHRPRVMIAGPRQLPSRSDGQERIPRAGAAVGPVSPRSNDSSGPTRSMTMPCIFRRYEAVPRSSRASSVDLRPPRPTCDRGSRGTRPLRAETLSTLDGIRDSIDSLLATTSSCHRSARPQGYCERTRLNQHTCTTVPRATGPARAIVPTLEAPLSSLSPSQLAPPTPE